MFAIEDTITPTKTFVGSNTIDLLKNSFMNGNILNSTLVTKYHLKCSYSKPNKYNKDIDDGKMNPKKLKSVIYIIDPINGKTRVMDAKLCEKGSSHIGTVNGGNMLLRFLAKGRDRILKLWRGDKNGGTHALGKKCGDWLQAQAVLDNNIQIRKLNSVNKQGRRFSNAKWNYSLAEPLEGKFKC